MMEIKKNTPLIFLLFCFSFILKGQEVSVSDPVENIVPFKAGEWFGFRIHYGIFNASYATLSLTQDTLNGIPVIHAKGYGKTTGLARWFFKVEDHYDSFFDEKKIIPYHFIRDIYEGGYTKNLEIDFDHEQQLAHVNNKKEQKKETFKIKKNSQDILSAFYYLRTFYPERDMIVGEDFDINMFFDNENYHFKLKFLGKETLSSKFGKIKCVKFRPVVQAGRVFKERESVTLWVTDDKNRIPLKVKADLAIGSLEIDLDNFKNVKFPFNIFVD